MVSKSSNYCFSSPQDPVGCLLLCEVALGDGHELKRADSSLPRGLPTDKRHVKGLGATFPDPASTKALADGTVVPLGLPYQGKSKQQQGLSLLYDEYIVYDTDQIKLKYLLKVKFNYSSR